MKFLPLLLTLLIISVSSFAQTPQEQLVALDKGWERALLNSDVEFLDTLLAEEFVWVHNHASQIDGKAKALKGEKKNPCRTAGRYAKPKSSRPSSSHPGTNRCGERLYCSGSRATTYHLPFHANLRAGSWQVEIDRQPYHGHS